MYTKKFKGYRISSFIFIVFGVLIITASLNNTFHLKPMGLLSIGLLIFIFAVILFLFISKSGLIPKIYTPLLITMALFIFVILISLLSNNISPQGIAKIIQISSIFILFYCMLLIKIKFSDIYKLFYVISIYILLLFSFLLFMGLKYPFQGFMLNPNPFGAQIFCLIFFQLIVFYYSRGIYKYISGLVIICSVILLFYSASRAAILSLMIVILTYILLRILYLNKLIYNMFFVTFSIVIFIFVYVYITISNSDYANILNGWIVQHTGKNLFSGRQILWASIIEKILEKPLLGYGPGASLSNITDGLSSHNLYLQIGFQAGIFGVFALFLLLLSIWNLIWKIKHSFIGKLTAAYFIGILFHQIFEVSLLENNLSIGLLQWTIIGIGISHIWNLNERKEES